MNVRVVEDPAAATAELLVATAEAGGHVVLTGGSSPGRAYELAAGADWSRATVWFGDERCVPPDDELSNYAMAHAKLLSKVDTTVMRMEGERGPEAGAAAYEAAIGDTCFDLLLLGLGPDSHIASLFPGRPEKHVNDRLVVGVSEAGMEPYVPRISMTLPCINSARHVVFLVTGASKAEAVRRAFGDPPDPESPAAHVRRDRLTVLLDAEAADE